MICTNHAIDHPPPSARYVSKLSATFSPGSPLGLLVAILALLIDRLGWLRRKRRGSQDMQCTASSRFPFSLTWVSATPEQKLHLPQHQRPSPLRSARTIDLPSSRIPRRKSLPPTTQFPSPSRQSNDATRVPPSGAEATGTIPFPFISSHLFFANLDLAVFPSSVTISRRANAHLDWAMAAGFLQPFCRYVYGY